MADYNNTNQNFQPIEVQTNGINIFGKENMLMTRYLDDAVSISFCYPNDDPSTGKRTYPKDNRIAVVLKKEVVEALCLKLFDEFLPAVNDGKDCKRSVNTTRDKRNILQLENVNGEISLNYYKDLNDDRKPDKFFKFIFPAELTIDDYNYLTGDGNVVETQVAFGLFARMINQFANTTSRVEMHAVKMGHAYQTQNILNYLRSIAQKVGAEVAAPPSRNNDYKPDYGLPFGDNGNPGISGGTVTMATVPEVNGLEGIMN